MEAHYPLHDARNPDHEKMRRAVVRKIDWRAVPVLSLLYFACFIDRTNIGNAKVAGLEKDLGLKGLEFNIGLAVFFITYILVELPSNYMLRRVGARIWLPALVFGWALVTVFAAFMTNFGSLIIVRLFLGMCEGGVFPGIVLYLSTLYHTNEIQLRLGIIFSVVSLSGCFGGLIAYGIQKRMAGVAGLSAWSWIFILEGLGTILVALIGWLSLCSSLESCSFLDKAERVFAVNRLKKRTDISKSQPTSSDSDENVEACEDEMWEWGEVRRGFADPQAWLIGFASLCAANASYSLSFFLPTLVRGMGHQGATAQLYSAFPYIPACLLAIAVAALADKLQVRGLIVLVMLPLAMTGYTILIVSTTSATRYAAIFLITAGLFSSVPCLLCILPVNSSGITKRATTTAIVVMMSNVAGFPATFLYTARQAPFYVEGHTVALALLCVGWLLTAANVLYCRYENACRASGQRDYLVQQYFDKRLERETRAPLGDRDPSFLFTL